MLKKILEKKNPKILVITPLKSGDKVSKITKKTLKRNDVPFTWVTFEEQNNPAKNTQLAWDEYKKTHKIPRYVIKIDNDIEASRGLLDKFSATLDARYPRVAYTYCGFRFEGAINHSFTPDEFNIQRLVRGNYISFNSLISSEALEIIGGFVTDDKYFRLLDWALWLKFYQHGFIGIPTKNTSFIAHASETSVSARDSKDYKIKHKRVFDDFCVPILQKLP